MGSETEYGISVPGHPNANAMLTSSQIVNAYATAMQRARRARWDFEEENPLRDARGFDPRVHFVPANFIVVQHAGDLVKINFCAAENVGDFRHGTRGAKGEPVAGHRGAVAHFIEFFVINRGGGREVQNDDGNFGALHDRQNGGRKRVSRDVQKNHVHIRRTKFVSGFKRFFGIVNQAEVDDFDAGAFEFFLDGSHITFEPRLEAFELRPVSIEADAEKPDAKGSAVSHFNAYEIGGGFVSSAKVS